MSEVSDLNVEMVINKLRARSAKGMKEHGKPTTREDMRLIDWFYELQCELLDGAVYIEQILRQLRAMEARGRGEPNNAD